MKKLKILGIAMIMALLVTGCSSSGGNDKSILNKKVEMETTAISKPIEDGTLSVDVSYPKDDYSVVKNTDLSGDMGYFGVFKGEEKVAEIYLTELLDIKTYEDKDNAEKGTKDGQSYVLLEEDVSDSVSYKYIQNVKETGSTVSVSSKNKDIVKEVFDNFHFSESK